MSNVVADEELQERIRLAPGQLIATRIKRARKTSSYPSHDKLGDACGGVTRQHLIKLEKGMHMPSDALLARIAAATGKSISFFETDADEDGDPAAEIERGVRGVVREELEESEALSFPREAA